MTDMTDCDALSYRGSIITTVCVSYARGRSIRNCVMVRHVGVMALIYGLSNSGPFDVSKSATEEGGRLMHERPPPRRCKPPPSTDGRAQNVRERQRRCRARARAGEKRYVIVAREHRLAEAMLLSGLMTEADLSNDALVEAALSRLVIEWIARWLK